MPSEKILLKKQERVAELTELISGACAGVIVDYKGITVEEDTALRRALREAGVNYFVEKNTLLRFAVKNCGLDGLADVLEGTSAIALSAEDETAAPRLVKNATKDYKTLSIKAGYYNGKAMDEKEVMALASIPGKEQLVAQLLYVLNAPVASLARAFKAIAEK